MAASSKTPSIDSVLKTLNTTAVGLSKLMGVHHSSINRWRTGGVPANKVPKLEKILEKHNKGTLSVSQRKTPTGKRPYKKRKPTTRLREINPDDLPQNKNDNLVVIVSKNPEAVQQLVSQLL
jgi:hypothetical protein